MLLRAYVVVSSLLLVVLTTAAFRQSSSRFDEITVERINVVDRDGTLRLVIANKDRMHPGVMDGVTIDRPRPVAGMIFFNDEGDEVGGLVTTGKEKDGNREASAALMFDQLKQDQTVGIEYEEGDGRRTAAFRVWDRPDVHLSELIRKLNAARAMDNQEQREAAVKAARASVPGGRERVFVGKNRDRASTVVLSDANGKPRLRLTVSVSGDPRIEFLDENGKVVNQLRDK
jgi:hypothetical protein